MEPFRIIVDRCVYAMQPTKFEKDEKYSLWKKLNETIFIDGTKQTVLNAIKYTQTAFLMLSMIKTFLIILLDNPKAILWTAMKGLSYYEICLS